MANTYLIDGVEYTREEIEMFKAGRQTKQRVAIIEKFEQAVKEEEEYQKIYREKHGVEEIESIWIDDEGVEHRGSPKVSTLANFKAITVADFKNIFYRKFWNYDNKGKNALDPLDQLQVVVSRIVYAADKIGLKPNQERKTLELSGEVSKYHPHGNSSIEESIKGLATEYKSQKATRILEGKGNFGAVAGDPGSAARYSSISGTPLLKSMTDDLIYVEMIENEEGIIEPEFIPTPIPIGLINGVSSIGSGRSNYIAERKASEVIDWIDYLRQNEWKSAARGQGKVPSPISITGSTAEIDPENGYIYYGAIIHFKVDRDDITKKGKFDVITHLPPKTNADIVIAKLKDYVPKRQIENVEDGSGDGKPTWISLPTGYIYKNKKDWHKLHLQNARSEYVLMWDKDLEVGGVKGTMVNTTIEHLAEVWFENREKLVAKRFRHLISKLQIKNNNINLIQEYVDQGMNTWKSEDIEKHYIEYVRELGVFISEEEKDLIKKKEIDKPTVEEQGKLYSNTVLSTGARAFLPENLAKNEIEFKENEKQIKQYRKVLKDIGTQVIKEAKEIIEAQENFFTDTPVHNH